MSSNTADILARTIYGEARGEGLNGMEAVAMVILNRYNISLIKKRYWWGNTIIEICKKAKQFSCWNTNDVNFNLISRVDENNPVFLICKRIAMRAVAGLIEDKTLGATHYHSKNVQPLWSIGKIPCIEIGNHVFYNDIER